MKDLSGAAWRKSSFSGEGQSCVEVAPVDPGIATRDSKNPSGPALWFTAGQWRRFLADLEA
ncbi:DUF397 domain-containing protein [Actinosynnema sp. NPDC004786]